MKIYVINKRFAYNCASCGRQMFVDRTLQNGSIVERQKGWEHVVYCKCRNCKITCGLKVSSDQLDEIIQDRDPYDYT